MPRITSVKPQRNGKRVNIYLDHEFAFGLDLEKFVLLGLKVGKELSKKEVREIIKKSEFKKVSDKLLRYVTLRPRSMREVNGWLTKYKIPRPLHKRLFNKLNRLKLIGDKEFARWWIEQRLQFKFKSKKEIEYELRVKGVDKKIIDQLMGELIGQEMEVELAKKQVEKKIYKWERFTPHERKMKISEYLARKGFTWDTIKKVVDIIGYSE